MESALISVSASLATMIQWLISAPEAPPPDEPEPWSSTMERIKTAGLAHQIEESVYDYHRTTRSPLWCCDSSFAFADGDEPLQLFWIDAATHTFRVRQLTRSEHGTFLMLAGIVPTVRFRESPDCPNCG